MHQISMTGDDWKSDKERKTEARAIAARRKAGQALARKLDAAAAAVTTYLEACRECRDASGDAQRGIADSRNILLRDISEYSSWLDKIYST